MAITGVETMVMCLMQMEIKRPSDTCLNVDICGMNMTHFEGGDRMSDYPTFPPENPDDPDRDDRPEEIEEPDEEIVHPGTT
jgi:hypothetical protein